MTNYERIKQQIIDFKKMLDGRVTHAFDQRDEHDNELYFDELYSNCFELSFMGKSCKLFFGATEYHAIINMLETILGEM